MSTRRQREEKGIPREPSTPAPRTQLQRAAVNTASPDAAPPIVQDVLSSPGQTLDTETRAFMEPHFGHDFSGVRVHTDERAAESAQAVNALAYTVGQDVVFGQNQYAPETTEGRELMVHELTHTIQQGQADQASLAASTISTPNDAGELEARNVTDRVMEKGQSSAYTSQMIPVHSKPEVPTVQRELLAYKSEHTDVSQTVFDEPDVTAISYKAAASEIQKALQALIAANKVGIFDDGQEIFFTNRGVDRSELLAAFIAAGYPKAADMTDALLDNHNVSVYTGERVTKIYGLFPITVEKRSQVVERQAERLLTDSEKNEARLVFGNSLNLDIVSVAEDPVMSVGDYARTPYNTIYFPPGSFSGPNFMSWLIHELTHAWQSQHGVSVVTKTYHAIFSSYDYGQEDGLKAAQKAGKKFTDFNTEQQGDILRDYYDRLKAGADISAWQPFVDQVKYTR